MSASGGIAATQVLPSGASTDLFASTGLLAAAGGVINLTGAAGLTTYLTAIGISGSGSTAGATLDVSVSGLIASMRFEIVVPALVTSSIVPVFLTFARPIPASAVNTTISLNLPNFGAGNTNATAWMAGFRA
jgi:hypothetical protein